MGAAVKRSRHGLMLQSERGTWTDGTYAIGRVRGLHHCNGPHPMRYRADSGLMMVGHCVGDEPHDTEIGWDIRPCPKGLADDLYDTLDDVWASLARWKAGQR